MSDELLTIKNLQVEFNTYKGTVHALNGVNLSVKKGEIVGLVGESGCGKSTLGKTILLINKITDGKVYFEGRLINNLTKKEKE